MGATMLGLRADSPRAAGESARVGRSACDAARSGCECRPGAERSSDSRAVTAAAHGTGAWGFRLQPRASRAALAAPDASEPGPDGGRDGDDRLRASPPDTARGASARMRRQLESGVATGPSRIRREQMKRSAVPIGIVLATVLTASASLAQGVCSTGRRQRRYLRARRVEPHDPRQHGRVRPRVR